MNKTELVAAIAEKAGLTKVDAKKALDGALDAIKEALKKGDSVALIGFGTFAVAERKERFGVNPRDPKGPKVKIAAKKAAKFKAGAELKEL
ncbi:MAG: HU family DNA-binding protein [Paludibacteraceae bacterium]|nr:HU family DNA-binding protein [Paludibacteraceae bacterium]